MPSISADELTDRLLRLKIVDPEDLHNTWRGLGASISPSQLLEALQQRGHLTQLQVDRIRDGRVEDCLLGEFKLMYRNASGSFARVYRACSVEDGRMVGVKVLRDRWCDDPEIVSLFHREGELGKRLIHPNIVPIHAVGRDAGSHYLVMDFIEGGNLRDFLKIRGKLDPIEATRFVLDMARALEYAFRQGVTHRDLKMTNVLMSSQGVAKLIDFGLAADESVINRGGVDLQQALEYSTLERHTNAPQNDPRSDLFFLGGIYFELLTGQPPYPKTRDREERKRFSRYRDVPRITAVDPTLPPAVCDIVEHLLAISPEHRYQTATAVVLDLQRALATLGASPSPGPVEGAEPVVMCVEHREKRQNLLRDYLTTRGFRVLILSDAERAIQRIRTQPPDCILFIGDSIGDQATVKFQQAIIAGRDVRLGGLLVLTPEQSDQMNDVSLPPGRTRVLTHPINMRDLRIELTNVLNARNESRRP